MHHFLSTHPCPSILFWHLHDFISLDIALNHSIGARKNDSVHSVKYFKLDWRRWVERYEADDG